MARPRLKVYKTASGAWKGNAVCLNGTTREGTMPTRWALLRWLLFEKRPPFAPGSHFSVSKTFGRKKK
jgi:hypothetical protein